MKMNKLAAGALALALGLGAVAPAVAAESKSYSGAQLFLERYEKQLAKVNDMRLEAIDAQARIDAAEKKTKDAKAALEAAKKAYEAKFPEVKIFETADGRPEYAVIDRVAIVNAAKSLDRRNNDETAKKHVKKYAEILANLKKGEDADKLLKEYLRNDYPGAKAELSTEQFEAYIDVLAEAIELHNKRQSSVQSSLEFKAYVAAQYNYSVALQEEKAVKDKYAKKVTDYDTALTNLTESAKSYGYVVQIGNNGIKLVKDGEAKVKPAGKADVKSLEEVKAQAEKTLEAAKLIIKNWPETVKDVRKDLDKLIEKQEKNIKLAEERIKAAKKVSLVSTAYADEDNRSDDQLIEDMLSTDKEINDKLDANEKKAKEENEKKPEEKKPEDKKDEEKKPEEKKPAKEAGKNVKTGVAGIAGVAGILAAASVAYAASKRD